MRVGIVVRLLQPAGEQSAAIDEAIRLKEIGHEPTVIFVKKSSRFSYNYEDLLQKVDYVVLHAEHRSWQTPIYDFITGLYMEDRKGDARLDYDLLRRFPSDIRGMGYEYLVCHNRWAGIAGYYAKRDLGIPYTILEHERLMDFRARRRVPFLSTYLNQHEARVFENADRVLSISSAIARSIEKKHPNLKGRVRVNIQGLDTVKTVSPYESRSPTILCVATWDTWRRPEAYLPVAERMPEFTLRMIGYWRDPAYKMAFVERLRQTGLKNVEVEEGLSESELAEAYDTSRFFLRFGFGEYGVAAGILQAIRTATPIAMSPDLGSMEVIREYGGGAGVTSVEDVCRFIRDNDNPASYRGLQAGLLRAGASLTWMKHASMLVP